MLDLEEERTEETAIIVNICDELEKMILSAPEELPPTYTSIQSKSPDEEQLPTDVARADSEYSVDPSARASTIEKDSETAKLITKKKKKKAVAALQNQESIVDHSEVLGPNEETGNVNAIV